MSDSSVIIGTPISVTQLVAEIAAQVPPGPPGPAGPAGPAGPTGSGPGTDLSTYTVKAPWVGTTARSMQSRAGEVVNLLDFTGFDVTGENDNTAVLQAAANQVPAGGALILLPTGSIVLDGTVSLPSNTLLEGRGAATSIYVPSPAAGAAFANKNPTGDHDITIGKLALRTAGQGPSWGAFHHINFTGVLRPTIEDVLATGGGNLTAFIGTTSSVIARCRALNMSNCCYDHWGGTTDARVTDCWGSTVQGVAASFCAMITGLTTGGADIPASGLTLDGCHFFMGGDGGSAVEVNSGASSQGAVTMCSISQCYIGMLPGCTARGLHFTGHGGYHLASYCRLDGCGNTNMAPAVMVESGGTSGVPVGVDIVNMLIKDWNVSPSQVAPISHYGTGGSVVRNVGISSSQPLINGNIDPSNDVAFNRSM